MFQCIRRSISVAAQKLTASLAQIDPEITNIIKLETERQRTSIVLIASENFTSASVLETLGSVMTNKYSQGYPGARYYGGNEFIDMAEDLCRKRALQAYRLNPSQWGVNVQPLSGAPANFYVYTALLGPHERMMALDLPHGGHLSHGFRTATRRVSATSLHFECLPYRVNESSGLVDYDTLESNAQLYMPKLIVSGASAYPREFDYERLRHICDKVGALMMYDMAHTSGIVAADAGLKDPFQFADLVTTTTHKSLRGPRGAMIFYRKDPKIDSKGNKIDRDLENRIDSAVFPGHQGGPHNHTITALAVALKLAAQPEFKEYQIQVLKNAQAFAQSLQKEGFSLVTGGTDNHLVLLDLRPMGIDGARVEKVLELSGIAANKNTTPKCKSAMIPYGLRLGTPAMTSRGFEEKDYEKVAEFLKRAVDITIKINSTAGGKKVSDFTKALAGKSWTEIEELRKDVSALATAFPSIP